MLPTAIVIGSARDLTVFTVYLRRDFEEKKKENTLAVFDSYNEYLLLT